MAKFRRRKTAPQIQGKAEMIHILDTDLFSLQLLPDSPEYLRLRARALELPTDDKVVTTIITYEEQTRGWLAYTAKSSALPHQVKAYNRLKQHLANYLKWEVLDFDPPSAKQFERLRSLKIRIGTMDLKIAAVALSNNAVVLTRNLKDFQRVPNLRVEDWTKQ